MRLLAKRALAPVLVTGLVAWVAGSAAVAGTARPHGAVRVDASASTAIGSEFSSPVTDGPVNALAQAGNLLYVGGDFTQLGPAVGPVVGFAGMGSEVDRSLPRFDDQALAAVADGAGGYYVGGRFLRVGGLARPYLVHMLASGAVDPRFVPRINKPVARLALANGRLFVAAGAVIGGPAGARSFELLAMDAGSGRIDPAFKPAVRFWPLPMPSLPALPPLPPGLGCLPYSTKLHEHLQSLRGPIFELAASADRLYVRASFAASGSTPPPQLIALRTDTGARDSGFDPGAANHAGSSATADTAFDGTVDAMLLSAGRLYVAGSFSHVGERPRASLAALDPATGALDETFSPTPNGMVSTLATDGERLYIGGEFTRLGGTPEGSVALIDGATGAPVAGFHARIDPPEALAVTPDRLYVAAGGSADGPPQRDLLALDPVSGAVQPSFGTVTDGLVSAIAGSGARVLVMGSFQSVAAVHRNSLAAIDLGTGKLVRSFSPGILGVVRALSVSRNAIFAAGSFFDRRSREFGLIALDPRTGRLKRGFHAHAEITGSALARIGSRLYLSQSGRVAAFDTRTGRRDRRFDPETTGWAAALTAGHGLIYAAGHLHIEGRAVRLVALDPTTGALRQTFRPQLRFPNPSDEITALTVAGRTLYAGVDEPSPDYAGTVVALDALSGTRQGGFRAPLNLGAPATLTLAGSRLYVGGDTQNGGSALTVLNARSGRLDRRRTPSVSGRTCAIAPTPRRLYFGGDFAQVNNERRLWFDSVALR